MIRCKSIITWQLAVLRVNLIHMADHSSSLDDQARATLVAEAMRL